MAVTNKLKFVCRLLKQSLAPAGSRSLKKTPVTNPSLQALTVAALALPGLMMPAVSSAAEDDEVSFQYSHYEEGKRNLLNIQNNRNPIEVDSVVGKSRISLTDRIKFSFNYIQDTWSGATPVTTSPLAVQGNRAIQATDKNGETMVSGASPIVQNTNVYFTRTQNTKNFIPVQFDDNNKRVGQAYRPVHVLSTASPETRKQGDFSLGYEWDEAAIRMGGGVSIEPDYESRFGNIGGRLDFNQKLTTLDLGLSYTNSETSAKLDHDTKGYIQESAFADQLTYDQNIRTLAGGRQDWSTSLALTQVLNKDALVQSNFSYTRSTGYMENPYKVMTILFADPDSLGSINSEHKKFYQGESRAFLEQRPDERNQFTLGGRYVQHIGFADAALHLDYRFFTDDWGINAHTFEADWVQPITSTWTITPKIRYYSQDQANFYYPYIISGQAFSKSEQIIDPVTGDVSTVVKRYDPDKLPSNFSNDQRLAAFGALSGGVTINKKLSKAVSVQAGFEYYTHASSLQIGGNDRGSFMDFDYYQASAALNVNLSALNSGGSSDHSHHAHHQQHHGSQAPAGLMFGHMLAKSNDVMVGYRYMYGRQAGNMLNGTDIATDRQVRHNGCTQGYTGFCRVTPTYMDMHMHMLDIMYAPTDWLNLMLMPQFMDMDMDLRALKGVKVDATVDHLHGGHRTGGIGDTGIYAMFKLFDTDRHHFHATLGLSAPTGDVDIRLRRMHTNDEGYLHYGMQLGSGTWDFKPSVTYTGKLDDWSWGAQFNATARMEDKNDSGYALGDMFQATSWGSYNLTNWLSASVRGVYTEQFQIDGQFNPVAGIVDNQVVDNVNLGTKNNYSSGPMDYGSSYGGRYWDVGFGLNIAVPFGDLKGNHVGIEWLQPVEDDVNGYQLERQGALSATWSVMF